MKHYCMRDALQSLLGKLLYLAKIIIPAWGFLNRMLSYLRGTDQAGKTFHKDVFIRRWFKQVLGLLNPSAQFTVVNYDNC